MKLYVTRAPNRASGWIKKPKGKSYTVRVDGQVMHNVIAADDQAGVVWMHDKSRSHPTQMYQTIVKKGVVTIEEGIEAFHEEARREGITP